MSTAVAEPVTPDPISEAFNDVLTRVQTVEHDDARLTFNYDDPKDNAAARTHVASLRTLKADIGRTKKPLKDRVLAEGRAIDSTANKLTESVQALIDRHWTPLKDIEHREAARKDELRAEITGLRALANPRGKTSDAITAAIRSLQGFNLTPERMAEFYDEAESVIRTGIEELQAALPEVQQAEANAAELETLRKQQAEQEAERAAADRRAREAEARAAAAEEEARKARESADRAAEQERRRIAAEAEAEANAQKAAAEEEAHRISVRSEAREAIAEIVAADMTPCDETDDHVAELSARLIDAIEHGRIPHTRLIF